MFQLYCKHEADVQHRGEANSKKARRSSTGLSIHYPIAVLEPVLLAFVSLLVCGTTVAVMLPMSRLLPAL